MSIPRARKGHVTLGIPCGHPEAHFARTLFEMAMYDQAHGGGHLHPNTPSAWIIGSASIVTARNKIVEKFLEQPEDNQSEWLLFLDDDQVYPPETIEILMASVDAEERPIVALPVWRFLESGDDVSVTHNVLDITEDQRFTPRIDPLPENALVQVPGIGTGCMMIHRSVFHRTRDALIAAELPPLWFQEMFHTAANYRESEDIWFCRVAGNTGIPIFVNSTKTIGHVKRVVLNHQLAPGEVSI